jgi:hypothetical protein
MGPDDSGPLLATVFDSFEELDVLGCMIHENDMICGEIGRADLLIGPLVPVDSRVKGICPPFGTFCGRSQCSMLA